MILQFKTPRNTNGHRHYLAIDTDRKQAHKTYLRYIREYKRR